MSVNKKERKVTVEDFKLMKNIVCSNGVIESYSDFFKIEKDLQESHPDFYEILRQHQVTRIGLCTMLTHLSSI